MDTTRRVKPAEPRRRRRHEPAFKSDVIRACQHPGVSIAAVALANGLNANLVRRWVAAYQGGETALVECTATPHPAPVSPITAIPVTPAAAFGSDIRLDLRRGEWALQIAWPVSHAPHLGALLKDLLR